MPFVIKVSAAVEEQSSKANEMEVEKGDESEAIDPKSQCYLQ